MIRNPLCELMIKLHWDTSHTTWNHVITKLEKEIDADDEFKGPLNALTPLPGCWWQLGFTSCCKIPISPPLLLLNILIPRKSPTNKRLATFKCQGHVVFPWRNPPVSPLHQKTTRPTLQPKDQLCSLSQDGLGSLGSSSHGSSSHLRSIQRGLSCEGISDVGK